MSLSPLPDFLEYSLIEGDGHQIQSKSDHVFVRGGGNVVGKHCSHIYMDGFNIHAMNNIHQSFSSGSHCLVVNSGSVTEGVPFEIDGVKKIGKAQRETLRLVGRVNDRGITNLLNPFERDKPLAGSFRLPLSNASALVKLEFVVRSCNGVATGTANNTVMVNERGGTAWVNKEFAITTNYNSLPAPFELHGVDMNRYSNSTAISISNSEGNGELQVFCEVDIICLSD
jgi:hypothetical protein